MSVAVHWIVALAGCLFIFRFTEGSWPEAWRLTGQAFLGMLAVTAVLLIGWWLL